MTRTRLALLTLGDPERVTGGYLFHRRVADRARQYGMELAFVSVPDLPLAWALLSGPTWLRHQALLRADALIVDSIAAAPAAPWLARLRMPMLAMVHQPIGGMDTARSVRLLQAPFDRWAYRRTELVMAASEWLAEQLAASGIAASRLSVVPPGKDPDGGGTSADDDFEGDRVGLRQDRRMAALCVANWLPRKGILELLEAVALLPEELLVLHLVGDTTASGRYAARVRRRLSRPDLSGRVIVHGVISAAAIAGMYRSVDVFVLPSFEEPFGTVWGEAMAAGLPVIGWRTANLPYLADHEREGLLAPVGDVVALARAMERIALEPELRIALGHAAGMRAASRATWDDTAHLFFTAVRDVVRRRGQQPAEDR